MAAVAAEHKGGPAPGQAGAEGPGRAYFGLTFSIRCAKG
jgi:hypothetical protein